MTASLWPPPGVDNFDHLEISSALSQAQVHHVWVIGRLLQPDHDFGTLSQLKSVGLICRWTRSGKN